MKNNATEKRGDKMKDISFDVELDNAGIHNGKKIFTFAVYKTKNGIVMSDAILIFDIDEDKKIYDNFFEEFNVDKLEPLQDNAEELTGRLQLWDLAVDYAESVLDSEVYP